LAGVGGQKSAVEKVRARAYSWDEVTDAYEALLVKVRSAATS